MNQLKFNAFLVEYLKTHKGDYQKIVCKARVEFYKLNKL